MTFRSFLAWPCCGLLPQCWGQNSVGQLGQPNNEVRGTAAADMGDNLPIVPLGSDFVPASVHAGEYYNCAVSSTGSVKVQCVCFQRQYRKRWPFSRAPWGGHFPWVNSCLNILIKKEKIVDRRRNLLALEGLHCNVWLFYAALQANSAALLCCGLNPQRATWFIWGPYPWFKMFILWRIYTMAPAVWKSQLSGAREVKVITWRYVCLFLFPVLFVGASWICSLEPLLELSWCLNVVQYVWLHVDILRNLQFLNWRTCCWYM